MIAGVITIVTAMEMGTSDGECKSSVDEITLTTRSAAIFQLQP